MVLEIERISWQNVRVRKHIGVCAQGLVGCPFSLMPNTNVEVGAGAAINNLAHSVAASQVAVSITFFRHHSEVGPLTVC